MKIKPLIMMAAILGAVAMIPLLRSLAVADLDEDFERRKAALSVSVISLSAEDHYQVRQKFSGRVVARRESDHGFDQGGLLVDILVDEGMRVKKGDILARLDQSRLEARLLQAEAALKEARARDKEAEARLKMARLSFDRYQTLLNKKHISQARFDQVKTDLDALIYGRRAAQAAIANAGARLKNAAADIALSELKAQFSGTILKRYLDEGASIGAGSAVVRLIEDEKLEIHLGLPITAARSLELGNLYDFSANGRSLKARLRSLLSKVDYDSRTLKAVFDVTADDMNSALAGELAQLNLDTRIEAEGFWLPTSALAESRRGLWSVLALSKTDAEGTATLVRRELQIIHTQAERVFVRGTLRAGDQIVSSGLHRLVAGQLVRPQDEKTSLYGEAGL